METQDFCRSSLSFFSDQQLCYADILSPSEARARIEVAVLHFLKILNCPDPAISLLPLINRNSSNCRVNQGLLTDVSWIFLSCSFSTRSLLKANAAKCFIRVWKVMEICSNLLAQEKRVTQRELFHKLLCTSPEHFASQLQVNRAIQDVVALLRCSRYSLGIMASSRGLIAGRISLQSSGRNNWTYDSLKNFRQISPVVQSHLKQVYLTLCCALIVAAAGCYLHLLWNIGGLLTTFACMGCTIWLLATPPYEEQKRLGLLMASSLLQGASVGPLIDLAIEIDPSILISAFVGTGLAFGCFSAAAMLARRREYLYLGGLLSSGLSILLWLHFASSIFGGSAALFKFELYFGLLVFVGYIVVDTQDIIEKAHRGDLDYVKHALALFTDFVAVFVRILIIMLKNSSDKNEKKKKRRDA